MHSSALFDPLAGAWVTGSSFCSGTSATSSLDLLWEGMAGRATADAARAIGWLSRAAAKGAGHYGHPPRASLMAEPKSGKASALSICDSAGSCFLLSSITCESRLLARMNLLASR